MASPKELTPSLPETLPEDFNDWDSRSFAAPSPASSDEREAWETSVSFSETARPLWQSADSDALIASLVDDSRDAGSLSSASVFVKQQEDLIDWDSEANPAPRPVDRTEWEAWEAAHPSGENVKSPGQAVDREAFLMPVADRFRDSSPVSSAPVTVEQEELTNELVDGSPSNDSREPEAHAAASEIPVTPSSPNGATVDEVRNPMEITGSSRRKADEVVFQLFSKEKGEDKAEPKTGKKKWITIFGISAGAIVLPLILMIPMLHRGTKSMAKHSVQPLPGASYTQVDTSTPEEPVSKPSASKPLATTEKQENTDSQPSNQEAAATTPAEVQSTMMNDQVDAPTRIPKQVAENAPPPAGSDTAGAEGLGGSSANNGILNGHAQPTVRVSRPVAISSGIATGMLIVKIPPVYPPLAKTAHVAGTVELHATIATNGTIKDLRAVGGPVMLRQAAVDAVRNWRYQPYKLNDQPVEVETTINIVFSLGG